MPGERGMGDFYRTMANRSSFIMKEQMAPLLRVATTRRDRFA